MLRAKVFNTVYNCYYFRLFAIDSDESEWILRIVLREK